MFSLREWSGRADSSFQNLVENAEILAGHRQGAETVSPGPIIKLSQTCGETLVISYREPKFRPRKMLRGVTPDSRAKSLKDCGRIADNLEIVGRQFHGDAGSSLTLS